MTKVSIKNILFNILAILTVIAVGFSLFNIISGAKGYAVTSDSMKSTLNRGDVVFSKSVKFGEIHEGDIITVKSENGKRFFTHRVVSVDVENKTVNTKGDNNSVEDPMPTDAKQIVGKMWYSVPVLGYFSIAFSGLSASKGLIILVLVAVVLIITNILIEKNKKRGDKSE